MASPMDEQEPAPSSVVIDHLTFRYHGTDRDVLRDLCMNLAPGARCLLIGANGSGKSTTLKILAGRHLVKPDESVRVLGRSAFHDTSLNFERSYLDTEWGMRTVAFAGYGVPLQADIAVKDMMTKLQSEHPERRDDLINMLGIDVNWRMHRVSDGQRRRVQIFLALLRPFRFLLLDEVTVSLDVVVRQDLMDWLRVESENTGCTIIYATHIFGGLDDWPTHLHYLNNEGATGWQGRVEDHEQLRELRAAGHPCPLLKVAETWLREEMKNRPSATGGGAERELGEGAREDDSLRRPYVSGGGFAPGRMASHMT